MAFSADLKSIAANYQITKFFEFSPDSGMDFAAQGIVVPWKGSNVVRLVGGSNLKVESSQPSLVRVEPITSSTFGRPADFDLLRGLILYEESQGYRIFSVTGISPVPPKGKVSVLAKDRRTGQIKAQLDVQVLTERPVAIAIHTTKVRDENGTEVSFTSATVEPQKIIDEMNFIWTPQANVVFSHIGRTDPALIDGLSPRSDGADIKNPTTLASLKNQKEPDADLTFFLVKNAIDGTTGGRGFSVSGVTDALAGVALVSDQHGENTFAHEAAHLLGAIDVNGVFKKAYGDVTTHVNELFGGSGRKIPYARVHDFNPGP